MMTTQNANDCPSSEYWILAKKILGRDPEEEPLIPPSIDFAEDEIVTHKDPVGGLSQADDQELAGKLGFSPADWSTLNEQQRIGRMKAFDGQSTEAGFGNSKAGSDDSAVLAMLGDDGAKLLEKARSSETVEKRMRHLLLLRSEWLEKPASWWAKVLGCSESAVKQRANRTWQQMMQLREDGKDAYYDEDRYWDLA